MVIKRVYQWWLRVLATQPRVGGVCLGVLMFVVMGGAGGVAYLVGKGMVARNIEMDLKEVASGAASLVHVEAHKEVEITRDTASATYIETLDRLRAYQEGNSGISYLYSVVRTGGGLAFVFDSGDVVEGDLDSDGFVDQELIGQEFANPPVGLMKVFETGESVVGAEVVSDRWGTMRSAYAPIFGREGQVEAVVGVDLDYTPYLKRFEWLLYGFLGWSLISGLFSVAGGVLWANSAKKIQGKVRELSRQKADLQRLNKALDLQAQVDPLTGMLNRVAFERALDSGLTKILENPEMEMVVAFLDLDNFKNVNDSCGHAAGDQLLIFVCGHLEDLAVDHVVGRFGGDELVVMFLGEKIEDEALDILQKFGDRLKEPFLWNGQGHVISASIGTVKARGGEDTPHDLIRMADTAMYSAKGAGKNMVVAFESCMEDEVMRKVSLENEIRRAWDDGEFWLAIQPVVDLGRLEASGGEVLLRWTKEDGESVAPSEFVPILESTGMISEVGGWILDEALREASGWTGLAAEKSVAVNVSRRQLLEEGFVDGVFEKLESHDFDPWRLTIEVTESMMMSELDLIWEQLERLQEKGIKVAMDDFGTGYSSLSMLVKMPIDCLKIDKSFVIGMEDDPRSMTVTKTLLALAGSLGLSVVAEGIETRWHAEELFKLGCGSGQGFVFAQPMSIKDYSSWCEENRIVEAAA